MIQASTVFHTAAGDEFSFDGVFILTFVEEDGGLKILNCKSFTDTEKRSALFAWADKTQVQGSPIS